MATAPRPVFVLTVPLYPLNHHYATFAVRFMVKFSVTQRRENGEAMGTMPVVVYIGDRLKDLRIKKALTQEELAERAGIGKNTVNRMERNLTEPRPSTLRKLAGALGVEPADLLED